MTSSTDIQAAYNELYVAMRQYIWDFRIVELLADLEIACYQACLNIDKVRQCFDSLECSVRHVASADSEFKQSFEDFRDVIEDVSDIYKPIFKVREELPHENIEEQETD